MIETFTPRKIADSAPIDCRDFANPLPVPVVKRVRTRPEIEELLMDQFTLPVEEFTTPDPVAASEDASVEELSRLMSQHGVRHIPIVKNGRVVGIVSERDLKVVAGLWPETRCR